MERPRHVHLCALIAILLVLGVASVAAAAGPVIGLSVGSGQGQRQLACGGDTDPYTVFRRGNLIVLAGAVRPKPAQRSWSVTVTVSRCSKGHFHKSWTRVVTGRPNGTYRVTYQAGLRGLYKVYAAYRRKQPVQTAKHRFAVT